MKDIFFEAFGSMFYAILKIFIIAFFAGFLVRKKVIKEEYLKGLSEITVKILLPSLIFSNIISTFNPSETPGWWILPLVGILTPFFFLCVTAFFFIGNLKKNLNKLPVAAFQNAGYLILPIGQILYPDNFDYFALITFLYILGFNPALWSIGKLLVTQTDEDKKFKWLDVVTPPLIANLLGLTFVFLNIRDLIPNIISEPVKFMGSATVPVATFILGATLGTVSIRKLPPFLNIFKILFVKFFIIPAFVIFVIIKFHIAPENQILTDFLVIEASAAPAANLIVMVKKYGGDAQKTGSLMLIAYFIAIPIMPLWIAIWKMIQQYA